MMDGRRMLMTILNVLLYHEHCRANEIAAGTRLAAIMEAHHVDRQNVQRSVAAIAVGTRERQVFALPFNTEVIIHI